ncbi:glycosyltransferase family 9 protein [Erwinia sp. JUb26]|uniref:glycosyltransferase family 9 protein n=1 Tax=Erwinia sp. JUb26 TaxID=2485126 RepID=UPI000F4A44FB|nr:glycosyltransferase family 9 protein [Erwinia sp. JUb26]ROR10031.1 ADP-heptose:LPS heptosyltransferase [Erwinia sp. JUb26]
MSLKYILRRIAFSLYDYRAVNIVPDNVRLVVIHIPDQIGDAMSIFPVIRSLERQRIDRLIIVASALNRPVFNDLALGTTKLTVIEMSFQDKAGLAEIKSVAQGIRKDYGTPDLCIEAMRKKNLKTMIFIRQLKARTNFQVVGQPLKCVSPACKKPSRMDQVFRAPVPLTWSIMMREAGFPVVRPRFEFPLGEAVLAEVRDELDYPGRYIALNFEGSVPERTFSLTMANKLISLIKREINIPVVIVHGPKGIGTAIELAQRFDHVYRLNLAPSIKRSAAVMKDAFIAITPDTSILHIASAFNIPTIAIYADYKTRWPAMQDISETIVVGNDINDLNLDEFTLALRSLKQRLDLPHEDREAPADHSAGG